MAVSKDAVKALQGKCGLSAAACRKALEASDGDVDGALGALIDSGRVTSSDLDPETVSEELFERAAKQGKLRMIRQHMSGAGLLGLFGSLAKATGKKGMMKKVEGLVGQLMVEEYGGKTPEQVLEEEEREEKKKRARLKKMGVKEWSARDQARSWAKIKRQQAALKKRPVTLKLAPFPPLKLTLSEWTGKDVLKSWKGTQERHGAYTSRSSARPSKGAVVVQIPRRDRDDETPLPPSKEQVAAYAYLKAHEAKVTEAVMAALVKDYAKTRKGWLKHDPDLELPVIESVEEMRKHVGLGTLHMLEWAKGGVAYYGLEMGCTWDEEHGAGVMVHKGRVVAVGQADVSFNEWEAKGDGGKRIKG